LVRVCPVIAICRGRLASCIRTEKQRRGTASGLMSGTMRNRQSLSGECMDAMGVNSMPLPKPMASPG